MYLIRKMNTIVLIETFFPHENKVNYELTLRFKKITVRRKYEIKHEK